MLLLIWMILTHIRLPVTHKLINEKTCCNFEIWNDNEIFALLVASLKSCIFNIGDFVVSISVFIAKQKKIDPAIVISKF